MFAMGFLEILFFIFPLLLGGGVPMGLPSGEDDPVLQRLATDEMLAYAYWSGTAPLDATGDETQQYMAQPEFADFFAKLRVSLRASVQRELELDDKISGELLAELIDEMTWGITLHPTCAFLSDFAFPMVDGEIDMFDSPKIQGLIINRLGDQRPRIEKTWEALMSHCNQFPDHVTRLPVGDSFAIQLFEIDDRNRIIFQVRDGYMILAINLESLAQCDLSAERDVPLAKWIEQSNNQLPIARRGSFGLLNIAAFKSRLPESDELDMFSDPFSSFMLSPFESIEQIRFASGLDNDGFVSRMAVEVNGERGPIVDLLQGQPLPQSSLRSIPENVKGFIGLRLPPQKFLETLGDMVESASGDASEFDNLLDSSSAFLGVDLREEVIGSMDDFVFGYSDFQLLDPSKGWMLGVRLRDEMSFQDTLNRASIRIGQYARDNGLQYEEVPLSNTTVRTLTFEEFAMPPQISWALADKDFLISFDKNTIGKHLRLARRNESAATKPSIQQIYKYAAENELGEPIALAEVDLASIVRGFFGLLIQLTEDMPLHPGSELTFSDIPNVDVITRNLSTNRVAIFKTPSGFQIVQRQTLPGSSLVASSAAALAWSVPFNMAARIKTNQSQSRSNMQQISFAMLNFESTHSALPAAYSINDDKQKLLSWRVHILPYLGHQELYDEFRLQEPWDSEHNLKLVAKMPEVFLHPRLKLDAGKTVYLGVAGPEAVFRAPINAQSPPLGRTIAQISDGASLTAGIIETTSAHAVTWTEPNDFEPALHANLLPWLYREWHEGKFNLNFVDGSTRSFAGDSDEKLLRAVMTCSGQEAVDEFVWGADW